MVPHLFWMQSLRRGLRIKPEEFESEFSMIGIRFRFQSWMLLSMMTPVASIKDQLESGALEALRRHDAFNRCGVLAGS